MTLNGFKEDFLSQLRIMSNSSVSNPTADSRQGWTSSPEGRGTISIIWSCVITTFLCCWSVLVINLPGREATRWSTFVRKVLLLGLCAAAPEIVVQVALGQWLSAKQATNLFHKSGYSDWSLRHSFFVDMGGLHIRFLNEMSFPINSRQLHYLITKEYVAYPNQIKEYQIRDRNKVDGTLRLITLAQTLVFITNLMLRAIQNLAITALELSTSAFVVSSAMTTIFWLRKPADVEHCDFIEANVSLETILANDDRCIDTVFTYTPLDYIGHEEWSWSILWMHGLSCLQKLHLASQPQEEPGMPIQRFHNTSVPVIHGWFLTLFAVIGLVYLGIFVAGWNYSFPSTYEQTLWRIASLTAMGAATGVFLTQRIFFDWLFFGPRSSNAWRMSPRKGDSSVAAQGNRSKEGSARIRSLKGKLNNLLASIRNNSRSKNPALDAHVGAVLLTWFFGFIYCCSRGYIFVADFVELRSLPASAYQTLNWLSLSPYVP